MKRKHLLSALSFLLLTSCVLSSRQVYDLAYQEKQIAVTLNLGMFRSIESDGLFNPDKHQIWDFDMEALEVVVYDLEGTKELNRSEYSIEVVEDRSYLAGMLRLYGSGSMNDKFIGVSAQTNAQGAFLKLHVQDSSANAVEGAQNKKTWEFASDTIVYRMHKNYNAEPIVTLTADGFFDKLNHLIYTPGSRTRSIDEYFFEREQVATSGGTTTTTPMSEIVIQSVTLVANNIDVYKITINGADRYLGVEYYPSKDSTAMKLFEASSFDAALQGLSNTSYNFDLLKNVKLSNKVIQKLKDEQLVLLKKTGSSPDPKDGEYYWDETDELILDPDSMTLRLITTFAVLPPHGYFGATNIFDYNIIMEETVATDDAGVIRIEGRSGKLANVYAAFFLVEDAGRLFFDLKPFSTLQAAKNELPLLMANPEYAYQNKKTAIRPYRLAENMEEIGGLWVKLIQDPTGGMTFDSKNTESFLFNDTATNPLNNRTLTYTKIDRGVSDVSHYKLEVVHDVNKTNGVFRFHGYDSTFTTPDETAPLHGKFWAIERGSEIYKTQARFAVKDTLLESIQERNNVALFNLHERNALPNDYRVIIHMAQHGTWVSMTYLDDVGNPLADDGIVPTPLPLDGVHPVYMKTDNYEMDFDTTADPKVIVTPYTTGPTGLPVAGTPVEYNIETEREISATYGIFLLKRIGSIVGAPNFHNRYIAVRVDVGVASDKIYWTIGTTPDEVELEMDRIYNNPSPKYFTHHAKSTVPLSATFADTINGIRYIASETVAGNPVGTYRPYDTKYVTFTYSPPTMVIETVKPDSATVVRESYGLTMKIDGGDFNGIFQLSGAGLTLNSYYGRVDIQNGANEKQKIRIKFDRTQAALESLADPANQSSFSVVETTHHDVDSFPITDHAITRMLAKSDTWASVDGVDKLYNFKNTRLFKIDQPNKQITIQDIQNGQSILNETYQYLIMSDTAVPTHYEGVVQLIGGGSFANKYVAFSQKDATPPPNNGVIAPDGTVFVMEDTFNNATAATVGKDAHVPPVDLFADPDIQTAFYDLGVSAATPPGFGTPSFVWMKNGAYDPRDTAIFLFDTSVTNVTVTHNNGTLITYDLFMLEADSKGGTPPNVLRNTALFYLKSSALGAEYNNHYVAIRAQRMLNDAGTDISESTMDFVIHPDRNVATAPATIPTMSMRDIRSASVTAQAINLAAAQPWSRLNTSVYQGDSTQNEIWEFKYGGSSIIRVTENGVAHEYSFAPRSDVSSHRAVLTMTSTSVPSGKYHNHIVAIGIGGESAAAGITAPAYGFTGSEDSEYMRFKAEPLSSYPDLTTAQRQILQDMEARVEWNFSTETAAKRHFHTLMEVANIDNTGDGWVKLKANATGDYIYDDLNTERWKFVPSNPALNNTTTPTTSSVQDVLISPDRGNPTERHGVRIISSTPTGTKIEFKIFRNNDAGSATPRSNTYVVLEYGRGLSEKLMRVGMGATLSEAQNEFNALDQNFNWSTYDRAVASWGPVGLIDTAGDTWTLQRIDAADTSFTASATTTSGGGHYTVASDGSGKPSYNPLDSIDISFSVLNQTMSINYIKNNSSVVRSYGLQIAEEISPTEGIYIAQGFGPFDKNFVYIEVSEQLNPADPNAGRKGRLSINASLSDLKTMNQTLKNNNTWNFFESDWIRVSDSVFSEAAQRHVDPTVVPASLGAYVELGFAEVDTPNVYDPLLTRTYTFIPNNINFNGRDYEQRTVIISNVSPASTRDDIYIYEIQKTIDDGVSDLRSIAILKGTGPDGGKFIGIRLPRSRSEEGAIFIGNTESAVETSLNWATDSITPTVTGAGNTLYRYRYITAARSQSHIIFGLESFAHLGLVTLDSDLIYVDDNTTEWSFDRGARQATVIEKTPGNPNKTSTYKMVLVKSDVEDANPTATLPMQAVMFLKGVGTTIGAYDRYFAGVKITSTGSSQQFKLYLYDGRTDPQDAYNKAKQAITGSDTSYPVNFVPKNTVYFPAVETIINTLIQEGTWVTLTSVGGAYDTLNRSTLIEFKSGKEATLTVSGGTPVVARFTPAWDENSPTKTIIQFRSKGGAPLPNEFNNAYMALDMGDVNNVGSFKAFLQKNIDINDQIQRDLLIGDRDLLKSITHVSKRVYDISRRALISAYNVSSDQWRQVKSDNTLDGASYAGGEAAWEALYAADPDTAPWNMRMDMTVTSSLIRHLIVFSRGTSDPDPTRATFDTLNKTAQLNVQMVSDDGEFDAVYKVYGVLANTVKDPFTKDGILNQYHGIKVGTGPNHYRIKAVRANSEAEARSKINALPFYNVAARETWIDMSTTWISNMNVNAFTGDGVTVLNNGWGEWVDTSLPFALDNHDYWSFNHTEGDESIVYHQVRPTGTVSYSYGLTLMTRTGNGGVYVLNGYGPHNGRILTYSRNNPLDTDIVVKNGARFFITTASANTFEDARNGFNALTSNNWVERRTLRESIGVLETLVNQGLGTTVSIDVDAYGLTPPAQVFNKRDHLSWNFNVNTTDATATVSVITTVAGQSTSITYDAVPQKVPVGFPDTDKDRKGVILLSGMSGPLNNKIFAVEYKDNGTDKYVLFEEFANTSDAFTAVQAGLTDKANTIYRKVFDISSSYQPFMDLAEHLGALVDLDKDRLYLDHDTKEYIFDSTLGTVNIITRKEIAGVLQQQSSIYFLNEVKGVTAWGSHGDPFPNPLPGTTDGGHRRSAFFLKGTRGTADPAHNHFLLAHLDNGSGTQTKGVDFFFTQNPDLVIDLTFDARTGRIGHKSAVHWDETVPNTLEQITRFANGVGTLNASGNNFTYNPAETEILYIDAKQKLILFVNTASGSSATNYMRFSYSYPTPSTSPRINHTLQIRFLNSTRDDLFFWGDTRYPAHPTGTSVNNVQTPLGTVNLGGTPSRLNWYYTMGLASLESTLTTIFVGASANATTSLNNLNNGRDPKIVSRKILENHPKVLTTLYNVLPTSTDYFIPVDANRNALADIGVRNFAFRINQRTAASGANPAVYDIKVAQRQAANPKLIDTATEFTYLTRILQDNGDFDGVIIPHAYIPGGAQDSGARYNDTLSNKSVALRYGQKENERKVKVSVEDTESAAVAALNALPFWNYADQKMVVAEARVLTNMAVRGATRLIWVQDPVGGSYTASQTTDWVFNEVDLTLTVYDVVSGVTNTSTYGLQTIEDDDTHRGVYQSIGFGSLGQKYIALDNTVTVDPNHNKAKVGIADTIQAAIDARNGTVATGASQHELQEIRSLTSDLGVAETIDTLGLNRVVRVDRDAYVNGGSAQVYDKRNYEEWNFAINIAINQATVTIRAITNAKLVNETKYDLQLASTPANFNAADIAHKRVATLINSTGPYHNKTFAIWLKDPATQPYLIAHESTQPVADLYTQLKNETLTTSADNLLRLSSDLVENYTPFFDYAEFLGPTVKLDQDKIYIDHETIEFNFDTALGIVTITERSLNAAGVTVSTSGNYFYNEVKGLTPFGVSGTALPNPLPSPSLSGQRRVLLFLKGSRGTLDRYHNKFLATEYKSDSFGLDSSIPLKGRKVFLQDRITGINDDYVYDNNKAEMTAKENVEIDLSVIELLQQMDEQNNGLGLLNAANNNYTYDPNNTETLFFDYKQGIAFYVSSQSGHIGTNYVRFTITNYDPTAITTTRITDAIRFRMISNTRTDLKFRQNPNYPIYPSGTAQNNINTPIGSVNIGGQFKHTWYFALGLNGKRVDTTGVFVGYSTSTSTALANLNGGRDPKLVPRAYLLNDPRVMTTLYTHQSTSVEDWYIPIDATGAVETDVSVNKFAFRIEQRTAASGNAAPVYDFRVAQRESATPTTVVSSSRFNFLTKVIQDNGVNDGIILPHAYIPGGAQTSGATYNNVLSNKYVALRHGTGSEDGKVRLAIGSTVAEANSILSALAFPNYSHADKIGSGGGTTPPPVANQDLITAYEILISTPLWGTTQSGTISDPGYRFVLPLLSDYFRISWRYRSTAGASMASAKDMRMLRYKNQDGVVKIVFKQSLTPPAYPLNEYVYIGVPLSGAPIVYIGDSASQNGLENTYYNSTSTTVGTPHYKRND